jgi:two-component system, chemotaxis family, protein-glutamate methylesterase/glutaminase
VRALVVDDSKPSRSIVARVLRELAFDCAEAANGEEALRALAAAGPPDLVTVNWHMPVMDGIELIRRLRGDPATRKLPLVMISTEHDRGRIAEALAAGADDYLAKPFTPEALTRKLVSLGICREPAAGGGSRPLKVLICDDSTTIRHILSTTLASDPGVRIAGAAVNGQACLEMLSAGELPDVVLLDVEMPVMDGLTALKEIRRRHPRLPVVMFSSLTERGAKATVDALVAGANDYVAKPAGLNPEEVAARIRGEVLARIKQVVTRGQNQSGRLPAARPAAAGGGSPRPRPAAPRQAVAGIVIAVSTGGPAALAEVLPAFVPAARVPILIVQHMPATFTGRLAERLGAACGRPVREGTEGMPVAADSVILAPGGRHLELAGTAAAPRIRLTDAAPENSCRPAADVLFRSAVRLWGAGTLGIVLTGMGRDGLAGSRGIVEAGGSVIAQDEFTSVIWGMPGEVVRAGLADAVLPLGQIGPEIALRLGRQPG